MRIVTRKDAALVDKLVIVAYGDAALVRRAIGAVARDGAARLADVIGYIEDRRDPRRRPRKATGEERTGAAT